MYCCNPLVGALILIWSQDLTKRTSTEFKVSRKRWADVTPLRSPFIKESNVHTEPQQLFMRSARLCDELVWGNDTLLAYVSRSTWSCCMVDVHSLGRRIGLDPEMRPDIPSLSVWVPKKTAGILSHRVLAIPKIERPSNGATYWCVLFKHIVGQLGKN